MTYAPKPRVCVLADVPNWAWGRKAREYRALLSGEYDITVAYHDGIPDLRAFDLVHLFEVSQLRALPEDWHGEAAIVAGLTANVWRTWGVERMRAWGRRCDVLHGNSLAIVHDLDRLHLHDRHAAYTPNGVDADFWQRTPDMPKRPSTITACHIGKPNPRKGADLIVEACRRVDMPLLTCQRSSKIALTPPEIRDLYAASHIQITASDMDGTPNPMLEAAAMSNALLSTSIGNMPQFIRDGHEGFLYDRKLAHKPLDSTPWIVEQTPPQREAFIEALCERLRWFQQHPGDAIAMGHMARRTVEDEWTWARVIGTVHVMWRNALARRRRTYGRR